ncbi:MAG TPA: heme peroxidase family protein [Actinomycetales bacterium]|nr:heme peroxidase family protein [Actinomycetales bacterium]
MARSDRNTGPTRRQLFSRAAAALGTGVAVQATGGLDPAAAAAKPAGPWGHAVGDPRGSDIAVTTGRGAEARFGLMFKKLPAYAPPDDLLLDLAESLVDSRDPGTDPSTGDAMDNQKVPAGFTFLGQFIDHDMTRDTTPLTLQQQDPKGLVNYDTPLFDLGSVYGLGPSSADKVLYEADGRRLKLVMNANGVLDLPRDANGNAFVGDPRNDENHIIAQLQIAFISLHNQLLAEGNTFATAQRLTRWRFQWVIVNDYLPHIVGTKTLGKVLQRTSKGFSYTPSFYKPKNPNRPMMPLEYSVAAFRFGHSMIRPEYEMHDGSVVKIFGSEGQDLRGSHPLRADVKADWNYFFEIPGLDPPDDRNMSRVMDARLAIPLFNLPTTVVPDDVGPTALPRISSLAARNLLRGKRLGMPSGQEVAATMGARVLSNAELGLTGPGWGGKAPLWYYVLKEAELLGDGGTHLGDVGGRIVAETILGLLFADKSSYLNASPNWVPGPGQWRMGNLLQRAGVV